MSTPTLIVGWTIATVAVLVLSDFRGWRVGRYIAKPLASGGFLALAVTGRALHDPSAYGLWIFIGLVFASLGDVLLMPDDRPRFFLAGLGSFLLGHVAYAIAFVASGIDARAALAATAVLIPVAVLVWRWLRNHLPEDMKAAVFLYVTVICGMEAVAVATSVESNDPLPFLGATLFLISDLAVARDRFVVESPWNGAWGLPLYYAAQLVLAGSIAQAITGT